jgi:uncharacterized protein YjbJ (UPF0337 family)
MSNKNKAKNTSQVAKGHVEEAVGKASGNDRLEADGKVDQVAGHVKQAGENLKDAIKE